MTWQATAHAFVAPVDGADRSPARRLTSKDRPVGRFLYRMPHAFPGFHVVERLYTSARSVVDRAVRLADGAVVVVKQASADIVAAEALQRAQHEFDLLSALRGPGVVAAHAIVRDGSRVALILENGGDALAGAAAGLSVLDALDIAIQLAHSLARMHAAGIVHRDVNPRNIIYDPATRIAKIIDFDIAFRADDRDEAAASAALHGTLHYLAPEQTGRLNRPVDHRADLYALGVTLYELLAGRRPFEGDDALAIVHAHLAEQPRRLDDVAPGVPAVIADIVARLLAKATEQRYQTAGGVVADLERCRQALAEHGWIAPFAIGEHDVALRFEFADRLYGRDGELRTLLDAFTRVARGGVETVLVSGYSGIGKSSLVRELHVPVAAQRGYLASGKFDRLHRDVPYSALASALGGLVAQILAEPAIERWRTATAAAVGDDGPLVRSVLPAIERVLG
ncbi:MAG TPA: AAA family ATPase, partial [Kofleriaceae bacterium]